LVPVLAAVRCSRLCLGFLFRFVRLFLALVLAPLGFRLVFLGLYFLAVARVPVVENFPLFLLRVLDIGLILLVFFFPVQHRLRLWLL
jgi:hypothetical protein